MRRTAALVLWPWLAGCALSEAGGVLRPTIEGAVIVRGKDAAETRWAPDQCISGDRGYFLGFDFVSTHDRGQLRAVLDPVAGPIVRWNPADGGGAQMFRPADCSRLEVDAQPTAWRVNEVRELAGHVYLRCDAADGTHIEGRISVDHCH